MIHACNFSLVSFPHHFFQHSLSDVTFFMITAAAFLKSFFEKRSVMLYDDDELVYDESTILGR